MKRLAVTAPALTDEKILTTAQLLERLPLTRQSLWRMSRENFLFIQPIRLNRRNIGWRWSAVLAWLAEREAHPIKQRTYGADPDRDKPTAA